MRNEDSRSTPEPESGYELLVCRQDDVRCLALPSGTVSIGRDRDNAVVIDDRSVSRHHAVLRVGHPLVIEDLGGANGTLVRDEMSVGGTATLGLRQVVRSQMEIGVGQSITLGSVTIVVRRARNRVPVKSSSSGSFVVCDAKMKDVFEHARLAARSTISVLILGETGVGKELLARAVHEMSARGAMCFMSINCATLSGSLLEGELFGYEKGAFTGATQARSGLFEAATGGTVFLDEVGELGADVQAKLLRVIEQRRVMRLGGRELRPIDVRFVAATNRDLELEMREGRFRSDLFYRLNGISLTIPSLRERRGEIRPLLESLLTSACEQLDRDVPAISDDAMAVLTSYDWPGNVRELRNVVDRIAVLCTDPTVQPVHLPSSLLRFETPVTSATAAPPAPRARSIHDELQQIERARIVEALALSGGNQTKAAQSLGMSRRTFVARLAEFNLPRPRRGGAMK